MHLAILSKQDAKLSKYEIETLGKIKEGRLVDGNILLFPKAFPFARLAYTKAVYWVLASAAPNRLETALNDAGLQRCKGTFAARIVRSHKSIPLPFSERDFAKMVWPHLRNPRVDLARPDATVILFLTRRQWFVCTLEWLNTERFEGRINHLLPEPHPTSLHPRLARAIVNILDKKSFLDPFCGAGGILIEGALAECQVIGSDLDRIQVNRARINLAHLGLEASLNVQDALSLTDRVEGIATDLPYGKNSKLTDWQKTYRQFFLISSRITRRMVVCMPAVVNEKPLFAGTGWKKEASFTHYLHKSLSKKILVLTITLPSQKIQRARHQPRGCCLRQR